MSAHTPGPWEVWVGHVSIFARAKENTSGGIIGDRIADLDRSIDDLGIHEAKANARLIAAAPELLECLKRFLVVLEENPECTCDEDREHPQCDVHATYDDARAAIAKATGVK